eukprot:SAG31_NODE_689_length_12806_cov_5.358857_3_plen_71_part_00
MYRAVEPLFQADDLLNDFRAFNGSAPKWDNGFHAVRVPKWLVRQRHRKPSPAKNPEMKAITTKFSPIEMP